MTTDAQLSLDLAPLTEPDYERSMSLQERFDLWISQNPNVETLAVQLAREWIAAGNTRLGIASLFEQMRWRSGIQTQGSVWKLDNSMRAPLARKLMADHPDLAGVFTLRRAPSLTRAVA